MTHWIRAFVDPRAVTRSVATRDEPADTPTLLALLSHGNLMGYAEAARRSDAPLPTWLPVSRRKNDTLVERNETASQVALLAMLQFVAGQDDPAQTLAAILRPADRADEDLSPEVLACAATIAALNYSENGNNRAAVALLLDLLPRVDADPFASAYLALQAASALERGQPTSADLDRAEELLVAVQAKLLPADEDCPVGGVPLDRILWAVARFGLVALSSRKGFYVLRETNDDFEARRILVELESPGLADLADTLLDESFKAATSPTRSNSIRFGVQGNKTLESLSRALLRAQLLADFKGEQLARRKLARSQIVKTFGTPNADPARAALGTLVELDDKRATESSSRLLYSAGPHQAVKQVAESEIHKIRTTSELTAGLSSATASLLRQAGDLLDESSADFLLLQCLEWVRSSESRQVDAMDYMRLASRLCRSATPRAQSQCAEFLLSGADIDDSFYAQLAHAIDWKQVGKKTRLQVAEWAEREIVNGPRTATAATVLEQSDAIEVDRILKVARQQAALTDRYDIIALLWNVGGPANRLRDDDYDLLTMRSAAFLERIVEDAGRGSFSMYGGAQPASVLARVALFGEKTEAWRPLLRFLLNRKVSAEDKTSALQAIAGVVEKVPEWVITELRAHIRDTSGVKLLGADTSSLFYERSGLEGSGLRNSEQLALAIQVGALSAGDALSYVAQLAGSKSQADRQTAAEAIRLLKRLNVTEQLVPLAMALMNDDAVEVRASATQSLAQLTHVGDWLLPALRRALISAAQDPGVLVPLAFLQGLRDGLHDDLGLLEAARSLRSHSSKLVRAAAERVARSER